MYNTQREAIRPPFCCVKNDMSPPIRMTGRICLGIYVSRRRFPNDVPNCFDGRIPSLPQGGNGVQCRKRQMTDEVS